MHGEVDPKPTTAIGNGTDKAGYFCIGMGADWKGQNNLLRECDFHFLAIPHSRVTQKLAIDQLYLGLIGANLR
jgi:hypothetical protein